MHPLLILLMAAFLVSLGKLFTLIIIKFQLGKFIANVRKTLDDKGITATQDFCRKQKGPLPMIIVAGLERMGKGPEAVERAIAQAGRQEKAQLEKNLSIIKITATVGPLLGFLGLCSGLMNVLQTYNGTHNTEIISFTNALSNTLIVCIFGLLIAIPFQIILIFFRSQIDNIIMQMEQSSETLLMSISDFKIKKG